MVRHGELAFAAPNAVDRKLSVDLSPGTHPAAMRSVGRPVWQQRSASHRENEQSFVRELVEKIIVEVLRHVRVTSTPPVSAASAAGAVERFARRGSGDVVAIASALLDGV